MASIFSPVRQREQRVTPALVSTLTHVAVAGAFLLYAGWAGRHIPHVMRPGDAHGTRMTLTYMPGLAAGGYSVSHALVARNAVATVQTKPDPLRSEPKLDSPVVASSGEKGTEQLQAGQQGSAATAGADSLGDGDMRIALAASFPRPEPDLHGLPRGFQGDVVVDVVIDDKGKIAQAKLVKGVSPAVDNTVIATVEQWTFTPATRDGNPVASEQELLFHYGPV